MDLIGNFEVPIYRLVTTREPECIQGVGYNGRKIRGFVHFLGVDMVHVTRM